MPDIPGRHRDFTSLRHQCWSPPRLRAVPRSALGPALNDQGYDVGRVERNLYTGVLAAADIEIFTQTTTFAILQSLRLGSGPSGPVHP